MGTNGIYDVGCFSCPFLYAPGIEKGGRLMDIRLCQALQAPDARALAVFQYIPCRLADVRDAYV